MRKTRLVILPGVRSTTQFGCLLLLLACPTIAFKGQEKRDIEPICKLNELSNWWLPFDTGEERNMKSFNQPACTQNPRHEVGTSEILKSTFNKVLNKFWNTEINKQPVTSADCNLNMKQNWLRITVQRRKLWEGTITSDNKLLRSPNRDSPGSKRKQLSSDKNIVKNLHDILVQKTSSQKVSLRPETKKSEVTAKQKISSQTTRIEFKTANQEETCTFIKQLSALRAKPVISSTNNSLITKGDSHDRRKLVLELRTFTSPDNVEHSNIRDIYESRRSLVSSEHRDIVQEIREKEFSKLKRNIRDLRDLPDRRQLASRIRDVINSEHNEYEKVRGLTESRQTFTSSNRNSIVLERNVFEVKRNIPDQRDAPGRRQLASAIRSVKNQEDDERGLSESRWSLISAERRNIVQERRENGVNKPKRNNRDLRDLPDRRQLASRTREVIHSEHNEYEKVRGLTESKRTLISSDCNSIVLERRVFEVKRNIPDQRDAPGRRQLASAIRSVKNKEDDERGLSESRWSLISAERRNIVQERRENGVKKPKRNIRDLRDLPDRRQLASRTREVIHSEHNEYEKERGLTESRRTFTSSNRNSIVLERRVFEVKRNIPDQRDAPGRRLLASPFRSVKNKEDDERGLSESRRSLVSSEHRNNVQERRENGVNKPKRNIRDLRDLPDRRQLASRIRDVINSEHNEYEKEQGLTESRRTLISSNRNSFVLERRVLEVKRNIPDQRDAPGRRLLASAIRSVKNKEDDERGLSESRWSLISAERRNIVQERRENGVKKPKRNIRDLRDLPDRRQLASRTREIIHSEHNEYEKVRGLTESKRTLISSNCNSIVLERRVLEVKRNIPDQRDAPGRRLLTSAIRKNKNKESDERGLSESRRSLVSSEHRNNVQERRENGVNKSKRNIRDLRDLPDRRQLASRTREVIHSEHNEYEKEQGLTESRRTLTSSNRNSIVLERRVFEVKRNIPDQRDAPGRRLLASAFRSVKNKEDDERGLSESRRSLVFSEHRNNVQERRENGVNKPKRNIRDLRDLPDRRQLASRIRDVINSEHNEYEKEQGLTESRRTLISSNRNSFVLERRVFEVKRNIPDQRDAPGRRLLASAIRSVKNKEDDERGLSESRRSLVSSEHRNNVQETRENVVNRPKRNIRDQRDLPDRRQLAFENRRVIHSENKEYDKVRGFSERRRSLTSSSPNSIVLERRVLEVKRNIPDQRDAPDRNDERGLSVSRRSLVSSEHWNIVHERTENEVNKFKRNIRNQRDSSDSRQQLASGIRTVKTPGLDEYDKVRGFYETRRSRISSNRKGVVLERREPQVKQNIRDKRYSSDRRHFASGIGTVRTLEHDKVHGFFESRRSRIPLNHINSLLERRMLEVKWSIQDQRSSPDRQQYLPLGFGSVTSPEHEEYDKARGLPESRRASSERRNNIPEKREIEVNKLKWNIRDHRDILDRRQMASIIPSVTSSEHVKYDEQYIRQQTFIRVRYIGNSRRCSIVKQLSIMDRNNYLLEKWTGFPNDEVTEKVVGSVKDKVWKNWNMVNLQYGQQSFQGFLLSTLLAGYVIISMYPKQRAYPNLISMF